MMSILVAYATKHQATAEIAQTITQVLREEPTFEVDLRSVEDADDISRYDAVVLGSAVYVGQWRAAAADFLKVHEDELAKREVWLFSSGPTGEGDPEKMMKGWAFPEALRPVVERIHPHDIVLFHGRLDDEQLNFLERSAIRMVRAPIGDFRDWGMIRAWAEGIVEALKQPQHTPTNVHSDPA